MLVLGNYLTSLQIDFCQPHSIFKTYWAPIMFQEIKKTQSLCSHEATV